MAIKRNFTLLFTFLKITFQSKFGYCGFGGADHWITCMSTEFDNVFSSCSLQCPSPDWLIQYAVECEEVIYLFLMDVYLGPICHEEDLKFTYISAFLCNVTLILIIHANENSAVDTSMPAHSF